MGQYKSKRTINGKNYSNNLKTKDFCTLSAFVVQKNMICSVRIRGAKKYFCLVKQKLSIWMADLDASTTIRASSFRFSGWPPVLVFNMNMFWMLCASFDGYFPTRLSKYFLSSPEAFVEREREKDMEDMAWQPNSEQLHQNML